MNEEAKTYLDTALDFIQDNALKSGQIDWPATREEVYQLVDAAQTPSETYPAIELVLRRLGDNHSFFSTPQQQHRSREGQSKSWGMTIIYPEGTIGLVAPGSPAEQAGIRPGDHVETLNGLPLQTLPRDQYRALLKVGDDPAFLTLSLTPVGQRTERTVQLEAAEYTHNMPIYGRRLEQNIGYLDMPGSATAGISEAGRAFAETLQQYIREFDQTAPPGWIVDLRRNGGGGCWQMWAGVGPLLDEVIWVPFVSPWSQSTARYQDGRTYYSGSQKSIDQVLQELPEVQQTEKGLVFGEVKDPYQLRQKEPLVAVLTGPLTASSGEFTALAFRGLPRSRSFGEPTWGVPTANISKTFSDGASIALTTSLGVDRIGRSYEGPLAPDHFVKIDWSRLGTNDDPVLQAAIQWLQTEGRVV